MPPLDGTGTPLDSRSMGDAIKRIEAVYPGATVDVEFRDGRPYRYVALIREARDA